MTEAKRAGWITEDVGVDIMHKIPSGTNEREPFSREELASLFANLTFSAGHRSKNRKAGGELQFWLPLISLTGGLISSEIMQLGPDTVRPHPEHIDIICFQVTNAGGRSVKAAARKRYVPVRKELLQRDDQDDSSASIRMRGAAVPLREGERSSTEGSGTAA